MAFANEMVRMCEDMKACRCGCPKLTGELPFGVDTVAALPAKMNDCYDSAALVEVYNYLRGGKGLTIPDSWRAVMPVGFMGF